MNIIPRQTKSNTDRQTDRQHLIESAVAGMAAKLKQNGITESCLDLFKSYLSNQKQIVVDDGVKSQTEMINAGIPQGS